MAWILGSTTSWISGQPFEYGEDDAGYYVSHRNHVLVRSFEMSPADAGSANERGATLRIAPLGMCLVYINGAEVTNAALGDWTDYSSHVCYRELPVGGLLRAGTNRIVIEMGNGWYNPAPLRLFGKYNLRERLTEVGTPMVACELLLDEASEPVLVSDGSWGWCEGQLLFNNVYLGEDRDLCAPDPTCDGRRDASLRPVVSRRDGRRLVMAPHPTLVKGSPNRVGAVREVMLPEGERALLADAGEMTTGVVRIAGRSRRGDVWELVYAETLGEDGLPCLDPNLAGMVGLPVPDADPAEGRLIDGGAGAPRVAAERDVVRCAEGRSTFEGRFSFHSFRYVLIRGLSLDALEELTCFAVHTDLEAAGNVSCGNELLDTMVSAAERTKLNNVHGIWEDCARERLGYGGDMVALSDSNLLLFDCEGLIRKTVLDFRSGQTAAGGVPETAPYMGIQSNGTADGEGPLLWQLAYPYLILKATQYYGARDLLEEEWPYVGKLADYLLGWDWDELSSHCLGDHGSVRTRDNWKTGTPDKEFVGWCAILWMARTVRELAQRVGDAASASRYLSAERDLGETIARRFFSADGNVGQGTQTAWAFAGGLGLMDQQVAGDELARRIRDAGGVLETGIFGTKLAYELLHRTGHDDVAEAWLLRDEWPSFHEMLSEGGGALAEQFERGIAGLGSCNHAMFSSYVQWVFQALAGLEVAEDSWGANHVIISPHFSTQTDGVSAAHLLASGAIRVSWRRRPDGAVLLEASWPSGVRADVIAPRGWVVSRSGSDDISMWSVFVQSETK